MRKNKRSSEKCAKSVCFEIKRIRDYRNLRMRFYMNAGPMEAHVPGSGAILRAHVGVTRFSIFYRVTTRIYIPAKDRKWRYRKTEVIIDGCIHPLRGLPSPVKGAGFRVQSRRSSSVRIAPLALSNFLNFWTCSKHRKSRLPLPPALVKQCALPDKPFHWKRHIR